MLVSVWWKRSESQDFSADKDKEYYTLRPLDATGNARIYVPVDSDIFMRNIITKKEACIYLKELESMEAAPFYVSKPAQLKAHYDGLMARHDDSRPSETLQRTVPEGKEDKRERKKVRRNGIQLQKTGGTPAW